MEHASPSRRDVIAASAMAAVGLAGPLATISAAAAADLPPEDYKVVNNRIHQSAMGSVLTIPPDVLIDACHKMGMPAVESIGTDPKRLARVRSLGMHLGYIGSHG